MPPSVYAAAARRQPVRASSFCASIATAPRASKNSAIRRFASPESSRA
jgi:hypothetical protein